MIGIGPEAVNDTGRINENATLSVADGSTDNARAMFIKVTSTSLSAERTLTLAPNTMKRVHIIENATTELSGNLDCIVNNAGITQDNLAIRMSLDEWRKVIAVSYTHLTLPTKRIV